ncbi:hypothetical protein PRZ48_013970 [Zasmidium cellare]|uniref:BTB domain-containing protein n=1 Tax=Zasmidium cellare TaxID=395010 RepID=A0ABR0DZM2_ZASCE|nr:hypothetical protein PRZ48_013970 [Zasmidium cellare]
MADTLSVSFVEQLKQSNAANTSIFVGKRKPDSEPYIIPKVVLTSVSPYFNKIVNCDFKEGKEGVLHFPEDDPSSWTLFLYWLFHRNIPEPDRAEPPNARGLSPSALAPFFSVLTKAWMLGDKYDVPAFQNSVTFRMIRTFEISFPTMQTAEEVFEITPEDCPLRKLIVEEMVTATLKLRVLKVSEVEDFGKFDGFLSLWTECHQEFCANMQRYPLHGYGRNSSQMEKYFIEEDRDLVREVEAMLKEHGQA